MKTISVDLEAYECLRRARLRPDESFSKVIKRASWAPPESTGGALLERLDEMPKVPVEVLEKLEKAQSEDAAPVDAWTE